MMKKRTSRTLQSLLGLVLGCGLLASVAMAAPTWQEGNTYTAGTVVTYNGQDYKALVTHTAYVGANWNPAATPSLWSPQGTSSATPVPTLAPTVTPRPTTAPTSKPTTAPTATPKPSATPVPTSTPATPTPRPTATPVPATPTPRPTSTPVPVTPTPKPSSVGLDDPAKKEIAMQLVSSAENSSLNWRAQYSYIEDIGDGRGYTAGIIGFCSGTGDMLELVDAYTNQYPGNVLAKYLPALRSVNNSASHAGLDPNFTKDWKTAAADPHFQSAQDYERDTVYFNPAVQLAKQDGLHALGQFAYYDAAVVHGFDGLQSVRKAALKKASTPTQGGAEVTYLQAFLDARVVEMKKEAAHEDVSRIETAQRVFLNNGNLDLNTPLYWKVYGDSYQILQ
ncbi:Carbohydrate binding domain-containing protein [Andreprevotia lacus DSM 23236]|jgi:hypothetical protein|uniref:Carbohydrate binding domain-containing protein n=1 Tax=Andreprevotia lacus DSM 23236 TaxID=1121001 RepID=A0A1W1X910_9NEIS|nr:chitosanase [Andreprevotia lacus]SMC20452.1 Carbohydrate binding domain-containing protein [Andreprevotia lacus DSM 23236]